MTKYESIRLIWETVLGEDSPVNRFGQVVLLPVSIPLAVLFTLCELLFTKGDWERCLSYRDQEAKALCADGCREETIYTKDFVPVRADGGAIHPHRLVCLNTLQRGSWLFKSVWDPEKHDAMCAYGRLKDGRWRVSLYSTKPEVDCGAIAKSLGGGGHRGAAGFICEKLPWEN